MGAKAWVSPPPHTHIYFNTCWCVMWQFQSVQMIVNTEADNGSYSKVIKPQEKCQCCEVS